MILPLPQKLFLFSYVIAFAYFMFAGARTFERDDSDELAAALGQFSFLCTGALATAFLGRNAVVYLWNGLAGWLLLASALLLYEWARWTVSGRRFHIAWSGEVPDTLCDRGPYAFIRHPVYLSYILAFLALVVAFPKIWAAAILLFNAGVFIHAAFSDERSLAQSPVAADYAVYRKRVGMFFPRLK